MTDFTHRESKAKSIPALLISRVPGFKESLEHQELHASERSIPGVVCGAFARFLDRIHDPRRVENAEENRDLKMSAHEVIETMASSPEMVVYVEDEIFENLNCDGAALEDFKHHLKPTARVLYQNWIAKNH